MLLHAQAEPSKINEFGIRMAITAQAASQAWIFLPRYSGVRPTISPAMNTTSSTCIKMPYNPAPTPPNTMQPSIRFHSGINPAKGMKLSCIEFTAPHEVPVVAQANNMLFITPNRCSLPSICGSTFAVTGFGCDSAHHAVPNSPSSNTSITPNRHQA